MPEQPPYLFPPDLDYPVAMAVHHHAYNDTDTPVSGDLKNLSCDERKMKRAIELDYWNKYNT